MKTKALLFSALCLASAGFVQAVGVDEDITPDYLKFSEKEVGQYNLVSYSGQGANPDINTWTKDKMEAGGMAILTGNNVKSDNSSVAPFNKGCHIVSTEYGNMLLIKAYGSEEQPELEAADQLVGFAAVNMYTRTDFPVSTPVRFQFVSKIVGPATASNHTVSVWNFGGATTNVPVPETPSYYPDVTKWWPVIKDLNTTAIVGEENIPLRIKYFFPGYDNLSNRAIYIASIKFTANPSTECPEFDPVMFDGWDTPTGDNTSTVINAVETKKGFFAWDNQNIYLNEMEMGTQVYIYSLNGSLVKTVTVLDSFVEVPMSQGAYVVKYGNKATKVIL